MHRQLIRNISCIAFNTHHHLYKQHYGETSLSRISHRSFGRSVGRSVGLFFIRFKMVFSVQIEGSVENVNNDQIDDRKERKLQKESKASCACCQDVDFYLALSLFCLQCFVRRILTITDREISDDKTRDDKKKEREREKSMAKGKQQHTHTHP